MQYFSSNMDYMYDVILITFLLTQVEIFLVKNKNGIKLLELKYFFFPYNNFNTNKSKL